MVMGHLCDTTVLSIMLLNGICAIDITGSMFGHNADEKQRFLNISQYDFPIQIV